MTEADKVVVERLDRKAIWKLCREFISPDEFLDRFGYAPPLQLKLVHRTGSVVHRAIKLKLRTEDDQDIETVLLFPRGRRGQSSRRATACISSQPGCGVGCPFCATSTLGYRGNLTHQQICEQVYWAGQIARLHGRRLRNVVFMGMGEPLHNRHHVFRSITTLTHQSNGFGIAPRHITVSTIGVPGAMTELARRFPKLRLALSLHAAIPELRRQLVPRGLADLERLREAIREINCWQPSSAVWLEVVLLRGINDYPEHIEALAQFCEGLRVEVNLIPYNRTAAQPGWRPSERARCEAIAVRLRNHGIRTTIRTSFGGEVQAACGQLTSSQTASGGVSKSSAQ